MLGSVVPFLVYTFHARLIWLRINKRINIYIYIRGFPFEDPAAYSTPSTEN